MIDRKKLFCIFLLSLGIGSLFIVFNPHPHGPWGSDGYNVTAWNIAQGHGYSLSIEPPYDPTSFRPPGYPIFVAIFFKLFGHHYLPVLIAQAFLNAVMCFFIFFLTKDIFDISIAYLASLFFAVLATSMIYASVIFTETLTTFLLILSLLLLNTAVKRKAVFVFILAGFFMGLGILVKWGLFFMPFFLVTWLFFQEHKRNRAIGKFLVTYLVVIAVTIAPWLLRNYLLSKELKFASPAQGGLVLNMGTLESGRYFRRWYKNPAALLVSLGTYSYSEKLPIYFECWAQNPSALIVNVQLNYSLDDGKSYLQNKMHNVASDIYRCEIPPQRLGTKIRYFISASDALGNIALAPSRAPGEVFAYYITNKFLEDNDSDGSLVNIFDIAQISETIASKNVSLSPDTLKLYDLNEDKVIDLQDIMLAKAFLLGEDIFLSDKLNASVSFQSAQGGSTIRFQDGSELRIPYPFDGKINSIALSGSSDSIAFKLMQGARDRNGLHLTKRNESAIRITDIGVDNKGIKWELNYGKLQYALALDNIKHNLLSFSLTTLKRMIRMWITVGSSDRSVSHPPPGNKRVLLYVATAISSIVFLLGIGGITISWRRWRYYGLLIIPILYFPLTHSVYVADARQTVPANPYLLVFCAVFVLKVYNLLKVKTVAKRMT